MKSLTEEQKAKTWWQRIPDNMKKHYAMCSNQIAGSGLDSFDPKKLRDSQVLMLYKKSHNKL